jgi:hypothetical protein
MEPQTSERCSSGDRRRGRRRARGCQPSQEPRVPPRALESAATCPYRWPEKISDDLVLLDGIVERWKRTGRLPGGWLQAARDAGLNWADDVSPTAHTRYRDDYEITLEDGSRVMLGPHLKRGAATGPEGHYRCYLHIDDTARRVIVGYVGRHLRDRTSAA